MTALDQTVQDLLAAVYADPLDLDRRLVLADALDESGDWLGAEFWRDSVVGEWVPRENELGWAWGDPELDGVWPFDKASYEEFLRLCPDVGTFWPASNAFARLRLGWERARKEGRT